MVDACRTLSLAAGEPLAGTALQRTTRWILLEVPGPWAPNPLDSPALEGSVRGHLQAALASEPGTRLQLIRRLGMHGSEVQLHVVRSGVAVGWSHMHRLASLDELGSIDFAAAWSEPPDEEVQPFILVCGHGHRDACCAREGVPVFQALSVRHPNRVWQTTHLGGHRFAATAVVLPWGLHLGRLEAGEADRLWTAVDAGRIHRLDRCRGETSLTKPAQAAAIHIREQQELLTLRDLRHLGCDVLGDGCTLEHFETPTGKVSIEVQEEAYGEPRATSCGSEVLKTPSRLRCAVAVPSQR